MDWRVMFEHKGEIFECKAQLILLSNKQQSSPIQLIQILIESK